MIELPLPVVEADEVTSEYEERILYLNGTWEMPQCRFVFRATIHVDQFGGAGGTIFWQCLLAWGRKESFFGREWVNGSVCGRDVELIGVKAEPKLATDHYQIHLSTGTDAGEMGGKSRAHGAWNGVVAGRYQFVNRKI